MPEYLIAFNDEWVPEHTPDEIRAKADAGWAVISEMRAAGVFVYTNGALGASTVIGSAVALGGEPVFSDGPYVQTAEHLGGFAIVVVPDDDAARYWAGRLAVALDWPQEVHRFPGGPAGTAAPTEVAQPEAKPEPLDHRTFRERTLRDSRFVECDLTNVVVRGSEVAGIEIDSPWLMEDGSTLTVNGVDVIPLVDAELNRRFPGRELRSAEDPEGLRSAWHAIERAWAATLDRAATMPAGSSEESVDGEWSLAQTLRHLVMATDVWLGRGILGQDQPYHPIGLPNTDGDSTAYDLSVFTHTNPTWAEILEARAGRQSMVREYLASVTPDVLAEPRRNPHSPDHAETVLSCLGTILGEEWEHLRYAVRDLDMLTARSH